MQFLVDTNVPHSVKTLLFACGHESVHLRDIGLRAADDETITRYALENDLVILTRDRGFGNTRRYPPAIYRGIAVLRLGLEATASDVIALLQKFMERADVLEQLPGKTAIVSNDAIQLRSR
ncbi:MAG: DUF5615 family PIN-like protein [Candidatus Hydrogenedentes bacterium]|nr:DUF5615 family PIN-like protein [Candidatus Hydrogenedentota bacterium]